MDVSAGEGSENLLWWTKNLKNLPLRKDKKKKKTSKKVIMDSLPSEVAEGSKFEFSHHLKKSVVLLKVPARFMMI